MSRFSVFTNCLRFKSMPLTRNPSSRTRGLARFPKLIKLFRSLKNRWFFEFMSSSEAIDPYECKYYNERNTRETNLAILSNNVIGNCANNKNFNF